MLSGNKHDGGILETLLAVRSDPKCLRTNQAHSHLGHNQVNLLAMRNYRINLSSGMNEPERVHS